MNFITKETLNILRQRIKIQDLTNYNMEKSKDNKDIIRVNQSNKKIYIGSKYSVQRDIDNFMEELGKINPNTIIIVFGLGAIEHLLRLQEELEEDNKVLVVEPDENIIHNLKIRSNFKIFDDDRFALCVADDEKMNDILSIYIDSVSIKNIKFIIYSNYNKIYSEMLKKFFTKLNEAFNNALIENNTNKYFSEQFTKCYLNNMPQIIKATCVNEFKSVFKNKPAVIVSAGPSLSRNIHKLKAIKDKAIIITGARTLKALLENSIIPDFICLVDPGDINCEFLKNYSSLMSPMAFYEYSNYNALNIYKGKKILFSSDKVIQKLLEKEVDFLPAGGSVAHTCTSLAIYMDCSPIVFMGQDFAYTNEKLHADISSYEEKNMVNNDKKYILVEDIYGNMVKTDKVLNSYRLNMEKIIEINKNSLFINCTEGGANMKNTLVMPLDETIDKYALEIVDKSIIKNILSREEDYHKYGTNVINYLNSVLCALKQIKQKCMKALEYNNDLYMYYSGKKSININKVLYELDNIDNFIKENRESVEIIKHLLFEVTEKVLTEPTYLISSKDSQREKSEKIYKKSKQLYGDIKDKINLFIPIIEKTLENLEGKK